MRPEILGIFLAALTGAAATGLWGFISQQTRARAIISQGVSKDEFTSRLDVADLGWDYSEGFAASSIPGLFDELTR